MTAPLDVAKVRALVEADKLAPIFIDHDGDICAEHDGDNLIALPGRDELGYPLNPYHMAEIISRFNLHDDLAADWLRLAAECEQLRDALAFYADPDLTGYDYHATNYGLSSECGKIIQDGGRTARAALGVK